MIADHPQTEGVDILRENDQYIESLQTAVKRGEFSLDLMPSLITQVVHEDRWRRRWVRALQREVEFSRFSDFVTAKTPEGLGASVTMLKRMCSDDPAALDAIDRAMEGKRGNPTGSNQYGGNDNNIHISSERESPTGTTADAAIRRLRKHAVDAETGEILDERINDLYEQVLAGDLSPHAAAVEAGFRKRMISIPTEDAERAARSIRSNMMPDTIRELVRLLGGEA